MLEKLQEELLQVETDLEAALAVQANTSGTEKGAATKLVNSLTARKTELDAEIYALMVDKSGDSEDGDDDEDSSEDGDEDSSEDDDEDSSEDDDEPEGEPEDGDTVVVKNVGRFMLHNDDVRFSPNVEKRTFMSAFIRSQLAAGVFVLIKK